MTKVRTNNLVVNTALTDVTETNLSGILKGGAGKVAIAVPDVDYATPALVAAAGGGGGGGGLSYDFVLNENITAGNIVQLLTTGKIEKITSTVIPEAMPSGADYAFCNSTTTFPSISYDPFNANKFVICYKDGADNYGKAVVGTISGTVVTFGSVYVFHSSSAGSMSVAFDLLTANRICIAFLDAYYNYYYVVAATISGIVLTFGSKTLLQSGAVDTVMVVADPFAAGVFLAVCRRTSDGYGMFTKIVLGSGTTISTQTSLFFYSGSSFYPSIVADLKTQNRFVISFSDGNTGNYPYAIVANTGASITFGTRVQLTNVAVTNTQICQVLKSDNTFVVSFTDTGYSYIKASVITATGTVISCGALQTIFTGGNQFMVMKSNRNVDGNILFVFLDTGSGVKSSALVANVSGGTITPGAKTVFKTGSNTYYFVCDFDIQGNNPGKFTLAYYDYTAGYYKGMAVVGQIYTIITNLSSTKLVGVLNETGTINQTKPVTLMGDVDTSRSGLTPNSWYYVQYDGSISTVNNPGSVLYGRAISTTAILTKQV